MSYLYILMVFKNILQLGGRSLACISRCFLSEQSKLGVRNHLSIVWPKIMPRRMYFKVHDTQSTTWEDPRAGQPEAPTHQRPVFWWALGIDRSMEYLGFVLPGWVATTAFKIPSTSLIHLLSNQLHLWPSYGNMTRLSSPAKGPCPPPSTPHLWWSTSRWPWNCGDRTGGGWATNQLPSGMILYQSPGTSER
jgi:hypothetical protein